MTDKPKHRMTVFHASGDSNSPTPDASTEAVEKLLSSNETGEDGWYCGNFKDHCGVARMLRLVCAERDKKEKQIAELRAAGFANDRDLQHEFRRLEEKLAATIKARDESDECNKRLVAQLAACGLAARGSDSQHPSKPGNIDWSPDYAEVLKLRREYDEITAYFAEIIVKLAASSLTPTKCLSCGAINCQ